MALFKDSKKTFRIDFDMTTVGQVHESKKKVHDQRPPQCCLSWISAFLDSELDRLTRFTPEVRGVTEWVGEIWEGQGVDLKHSPYVEHV